MEQAAPPPPPPGAPPPSPPSPAPPGYEEYPVRFAVEYPDRKLSRLTTAFRLFTVIPIAIVLGLVSGGGYGGAYGGDEVGKFAFAAGGFLIFAPLVMILFRKKYPRWWFDWNLELLRFSNRVSVYYSLMDDNYPSTDEQQSVRLDIDYPDAERDLARGMPLVKWLLATRTTSC